MFCKLITKISHKNIQLIIKNINDLSYSLTYVWNNFYEIIIF